MKQWFVGETVRNRQDEAALSVTPLGFEAYVPCILRFRRIGRRIVEMDEPRFGTYIFVRFDRTTDPWPELLRGHGVVNSHFKRFLGDSNHVPTPVPDRAIEVIMEYKPPSIGQPQPITYQPGQRVTWIKAGIRREGVFVEYCGKRPFIRTWIFGAERISEVSQSELEPLDLDIAQASSR